MLKSTSVSHQKLWLQIVALGLVYPSVLLIYFGEAAYLMHHTQDFAQSYFKVGRCRDARSGCHQDLMTSEHLILAATQFAWPATILHDLQKK